MPPKNFTALENQMVHFYCSSGTKEQYNELRRLITDAISLDDDRAKVMKTKKEQKKKEKDKDVELAKQLRDAGMRTVKRKNGECPYPQEKLVSPCFDGRLEGGFWEVSISILSPFFVYIVGYLI